MKDQMNSYSAKKCGVGGRETDSMTIINTLSSNAKFILLITRFVQTKANR
jgi:hypothetical protein